MAQPQPDPKGLGNLAAQEGPILIAATPLPLNFPTCREPHGPDAMGLQATFSPWDRGLSTPELGNGKWEASLSVKLHKTSQSFLTHGLQKQKQKEVFPTKPIFKEKKNSKAKTDSPLFSFLTPPPLYQVIR